MKYVPAIVIFAAYLMIAKFCLSIDAVSGFATLVWPPSGIALAGMLIFGFRIWPAIFLGAFLVNFTTGAPLLSALCMSIGNTLEAVVAAYVLRNFTKFRNDLSRINDIFALVIVGCLCSTVISATLGLFAMWYGHLVSEGFIFTWRAWWTGDALGDLIVAPLILVCATYRIRKAPVGHWIEGVCLAAMLVAMNIALFSGAGNLSLAYMLFPVLIWAALRFNQIGGVLSIFLIAVASIWGTHKGHGPFSHGEARENLFQLHAFISVMALTTLALAAAVLERKFAEQQNLLTAHREQLARQKSERALELRDDFLSVASHELRTPLTALYLQLQIIERVVLRSREHPLDIEGLHRKLISSQAQAKQLGDLIDVLLDVSRDSEDGLTLEKENINLTALVRETVGAFQAEAQAAGSEMMFSSEGDIYAVVDRLRILQAVTNLLSNAIKYGGGNRINVCVSANRETARISVRDQGHGISFDDQARIFDKFARAVSHHNISGLGLGLFIAKQVAQAHHGRIQLHSEMHKGSEFILELPRGNFKLENSLWPNQISPN